jgi:hypothetical protein
MNNLQKFHQDAVIKGSVLGVLTYVAVKANVSTEVVALAIPAVAAGLSWLSTKIGDKNTALLVKLAVAAVEQDKKKSATPTKVPAKKKK